MNAIRGYIVFAVFVGSLCLSRGLHAGDGFPPFGAWAYGSGVSRVSARPFHHFHYHRSYRSPFYSAFSPSYFYSARLYSPFYSAYFYRPYVSPFSYHSPYFSSRVTYQSYPSFYYSSSCYPQFPIAVTPVAQTVTAREAVLYAAGDTLRQQLVQAADAILKAGGFREAATAYAQLSVRYGPSPDLLVRRFVANVLARDFDQAEIIVSMAKLSEQELSAVNLGSEDLTGFLQSPILLEAATEALAARALAQQNDPVALRSIGTWLGLAGEHERAALFVSASDDLAGGDWGVGLPKVVPTSINFE